MFYGDASESIEMKSQSISLLHTCVQRPSEKVHCSAASLSDGFESNAQNRENNYLGANDNTRVNLLLEQLHTRIQLDQGEFEKGVDMHTFNDNCCPENKSVVTGECAGTTASEVGADNKYGMVNSPGQRAGAQLNSARQQLPENNALHRPNDDKVVEQHDLKRGMNIHLQRYSVLRKLCFVEMYVNVGVWMVLLVDHILGWTMCPIVRV
jgi:hypothetical protein